MTKSADEASDLVSIGQLASATGVSSRTIRYYEELGILPEARRSPGGTRKYPREYGGYIEAALALKDLGFRLEEIKPLARMAAGRTVTASQRDTAARLVEEKIETLARQVTVLRRLHDSVRMPDAEVPVSAVLGTAAVGKADPPTGQAAEPSRHAPEPARHAPEASGQAAEPSRQAPEPSRQAPEPSRQAPEPSRQAPEPSRQAAEPSGGAAQPPADAGMPWPTAAAEAGPAPLPADLEYVAIASRSYDGAA